jgi:hypothetical protein
MKIAIRAVARCKREAIIGGKRPWHNRYRRSQSSTEGAEMTTAKEDAEKQLAKRANFERLKAKRLAREAAASK